jgi:hypothetical protein
MHDLITAIASPRLARRLLRSAEERRYARPRFARDIARAAQQRSRRARGGV